MGDKNEDKNFYVPIANKYAMNGSFRLKSDKNVSDYNIQKIKVLSMLKI